MNMIPFITIFLLVFALLSTRFASQAQNSAIEQIAHTGYLAAERQAQDRVEIRAFEAYKKAHKHPQNGEKRPARSSRQKKERKDYLSSRLQLPPSEGGKINLYPLFQQESSAELEQIARSLFVLLYRSKCEEEVLSRLFDNLLEKGRKIVKAADEANQKLTSLSFSDLYPEENRTLYYRLLKGTRHVDLQTGKGIPPLDYFFKIKLDEKITKKPIRFAHAPFPLLASCFSPSFAQKILDKERDIWQKEEKKRSLTAHELDELAMHESHMAQKLMEIKPWMRFEKAGSLKSEEILAIDDVTGITAIRKEPR